MARTFERNEQSYRQSSRIGNPNRNPRGKIKCSKCRSNVGSVWLVASLEMTVLNDLILEDHSFDISPDNSGTTEEDPIIEELISHFLDTPSKQPPFQIDQNIRTQIESPADVVPHVTRTHSKNNDNEEDRDFKSPPEAGKNQSKPQYQCSQCVKNFTRNFQLRLHMISIHGIGDGPQYPCEICKKVFASKNSLTYHCKALHSVERQFRCPHCDKGFVLRTQLTSHIGIHSGQVKARIHLCMECGKSWPTKSDLRTHMRSHNTNGERPYKCKQCDRSFYTKGHLKEHHLVHTGEKPYVCVFCLKAYKSAGSLNTHIYRIHNELLTVNTTAAKMTATKTPMMMMMASGQTEKNFS